MTSYRGAPIRQKLLVILVATTAIALALAGAGIVAVDSLLFQSVMERDLEGLASIAADNTTAALQFDDPRVATQVLTALRARVHMVAACLYRANGSLFARYARPGAPPGCPAPLAADIIRSEHGVLIDSHPVILQGKRVGTVVLVYDRGELSERMRLYSAIVVSILVFAILIALALSSRLRHVIARPISRLAQAAGAIAATGDYGIRVPKESDDELGVLVDAFNEMLAHIQSRDAEAQNARKSLETTLTSIGDAVISTDTEGCVVFANPVAQALLRWPAAELAGKRIEEVFRIENEYTRRIVESPVERVLREGTIVGLANHTILIAHDGTKIPIDDSAAPILQNGKVMGVVLVFRDISERRRAQQDAAYLAAIVESSDDAIIGKSPDGVIQTWNKGAERLYGFTAEEVIGRPLIDLLPEDRKQEEIDFLARLRRDERIVHHETVRVRKDGSQIDISLTISPIRDRGGQIIGLSHTARDITEQKRAAEQMRQTQKLESLGVLAGGIAHDFNNLLTGIMGNASIVLDDLPPGSAVAGFLEAIVSASERAAQLARQMLAYSGKGRFLIEPINISKRVRETLPLIRAAISSSVQLDLRLDDDIPLIEGDTAQIQQVIMNVIINGAEAIPEGVAGLLRITTRREEIAEDYIRNHAAAVGELSSGLHILFEVRDNGSGMDEATLARIFDPFFTTKFTGRGLGLAAVLGIVRSHHGSVEVSSVLGRGTTFRFLFPAAGKAKSKEPDAPARAPSALRGDGLVLVVDDEQVVRTLAQQALERYGYHVLVAENGARALDLFRRERDRIQCVVLDLTMPVMSGEETLEHMKALRPDVPVILSSGYSEMQAVERFQGKGLAGFLQKPYPATALLEKVKSVVKSNGTDGSLRHGSR